MPHEVTRRDLKRVQKAIARFHSFVYRLAFHVLKNSSDAEDVAQGVFLQLLRSPMDLAGVDRERAWFARVTLNRALSLLRSEDRRRRRETAWAAGKPQESRGDAMTDSDAMGGKLHEAITALPEDLRIPVILHYLEGFKYRDIARVCDCPEGTVAKRISMAKSRLKRELERSGGTALLPGFDALLRSGAAVPAPPGLEGRLLAKVGAEFLRLTGGGAAAGSGAGGLMSLLNGAAAKFGIALALSTLIALGAWQGMRRVVDSGALREEPPAALGERTAGRSRLDRHLLARPRPRSSRARGWAVAGAAAGAPAAAIDRRVPEPASPGAAAVFGWVRGPGGEPLAGVTVGVVAAGNETAVSTVTAADGYYEFRDLKPPEGSYLSDVNVFWKRAFLGNAYQVAFTADGTRLHTAGTGIASADLDADGFVDLFVGNALIDSSHSVDPHAGMTDPRMTDRSQCGNCHRDQAVSAVNSGLVYLRQAQALRLQAEHERAQALAEVEFARAQLDMDGVVREAAFDAVARYEVAADELLLKISDQAAQYREIRSWIAAEPQSPKWEVHLVARLEDRETRFSDPFAIEPEDRVQCDFILPPAKRISGTVRGAAAGGPIAGAEVRVAALEGDRLLPESAARVETGAEGQYHFSMLPPGTYVLRASASGRLPGEALVRPGDPAVDFELAAAGALEVKAVRRNDGKAIAGLRVQLRDESRDGSRVAAEADTGEDGAARFEGLVPGNYSLIAFPADSSTRYPWARMNLSVPAGETMALRLEADAAAAVRGRVTGPAAGAGGKLAVRAVLLDGIDRTGAEVPEAGAGDDGSFELAGLPPGRYLVAVVRADSGSGDGVLGLSELAIRPGEESVEVELPLRPAAPAFLRVEVYGADGAPLPGASVALSRPLLGTRLEGKTGKDGAAELQAFPGDFALEVAADGLEPWSLPDLPLRAGEWRDIRVLLSPARDPGNSAGDLQAALSGGKAISVQGTVSLRALIGLLSAVRRGSIAVDPALERSGLLDAAEVHGPLAGSPADFLRETFENHRIAWRALGSRVWIGQR